MMFRNIYCVGIHFTIISANLMCQEVPTHHYSSKPLDLSLNIPHRLEPHEQCIQNLWSGSLDKMIKNSKTLPLEALGMEKKGISLLIHLSTSSCSGSSSTTVMWMCLTNSQRCFITKFKYSYISTREVSIYPCHRWTLYIWVWRYQIQSSTQ